MFRPTVSLACTLALAALRLAMKTRSNPSGRRCRLHRNTSRTRRLMRLRVTAFPTLRVTVIPRRLGPGLPWAKTIMKCSA